MQSTFEQLASFTERQPRTAVVHDWMPVFAGAERVLDQVLKANPEADVFTLFDFIPEDQRGFLQNRDVHTSFIQKLPFAQKYYRYYLPFCPLAIEGFDFSEYDLVVSSSYAVAKGVLTSADQLHVSYVHSPIRYAWDLHFEYLREGGYTSGVKRLLARYMLHQIRKFDVVSATRPDVLVANSRHVAHRIWKTYRRRAEVVYPPVDVDAFPLYEHKEDVYVTVGRLVPYKRVDLIVEAFNQMPDKELVVIGDGPEMERLEAMAAPNVHLLGQQPHEVLLHYLQRARAFVFAALEDFGIAPVEAQACGTPVLAYGRGGATETVVPGVSGFFFPEQTADSLINAVLELEAKRDSLEPAQIRACAERFSSAHFRRRFSSLVANAWADFRSGQLETVPLAALSMNQYRRPQGIQVEKDLRSLTEGAGGDGAEAVRSLSLAVSEPA